MIAKEISQFIPNDEETNEVVDSPMHQQSVEPQSTGIPSFKKPPIKKVKPLPAYVLKAYRHTPPEELTHGNIYDSARRKE